MTNYTFHITLYDLFFFGIVFVGLAFALLLAFVKSINQNANRFLALALATMILWMIRILAIDLKLEIYLPRWDWLPMQFLLALGPLMYFYVLKITRPACKFTWKALLHFSPLLLEQGAFLLEIRQSIHTGTSTNATPAFQLLNPVLQLFIFISIITYLYRCHRLIENFYGRLQPVLMDRSRLEFRWLRRLIVATALLWFLWVTYTAMDYFAYHNHLSINNYYPFYIFFVVISIWTAVAAFLNPQAAVVAQTAAPVKQPVPAELWAKGAWLKRAMETNLYYQDPELSLSSLAEKLSLSPHELSKIINTALKKSFNDFINEYRVMEAARKMQDPAYDNITLLGIAFEAGFNSQSTFSRIFKQITGKSPTDFKKNPKKGFPSYNLRSPAQSARVISYQQATPKWPEMKLKRNYMFRNYLKLAWRNLWKNKAFSAINIIGLSVGMAACIIIMLFVTYEKSFDNFHTKNIYRLNEVQKFPGMMASQKVGISMFPMGPTMKNEFPGIKNFTRVYWQDNYPLTTGDKTEFFPSMFYVDSTFLQMFDFKLLRGNRETALQKPNSIVLTQASATKLFGNEDPVGKTITHYADDTTSFLVTGILENVPQNSHMQFDGLMSFSTMIRPEMMQKWDSNWLDTYFELAPDANTAAMTKQFPDYLKKHINGESYKYYELFLLPLKDVHAGAGDIGLDYINYQKFDKNYTNIFSFIALIVLVIACVNFMNLSTARSAERAREVGIRKSIGALRIQLALQFIGETVLLSLIALVFAVILVEIALPYVNNLSQRSLHMPLSFANGTLLYIIGATLLVGVLSGLYPAAYLSSFQPVKVLKGAMQTGKNKGILRNVLVVSQFSIAIFLMIATIFVVRQLTYMQHKDPGFNREQVVTISLDDITDKKYDLLKQQLLTSNLVTGVTGAQYQLGGQLGQVGISFKGDGPERDLTATKLIVDPDYLRLYKIGLVAGRNFSREKSANGREYIINEALAKELLKDGHTAKIESLLGKQFGFDSLGYIVGIAKDFNFNSLHHKIETMFIFSQAHWRFNTVSVKINGDRTTEVLAFITSTWKKIFNGHPFEYQFLDDHFNDVYRADMQVSRIVGILAVLAVAISCLGLFGLASYSAEKRIKEVGIRKVMGASVQSIVSLLSRQFVKLVLIANLIAWPAAWFTMNAWLQDYAYRINISWWVFIIAGTAALLIALLTVSYQAIRAAVANPVKSLKSE